MEKLIEQLKNYKVKDGFAIQYKGELNQALWHLKNMTTACFETNNDINTAYTKGFNYGIDIAIQLLTSSQPEDKIK